MRPKILEKSFITTSDYLEKLSEVENLLLQYGVKTINTYYKRSGAFLKYYPATNNYQFLPSWFPNDGTLKLHINDVIKLLKLDNIKNIFDRYEFIVHGSKEELLKVEKIYIKNGVKDKDSHWNKENRHRRFYTYLLCRDKKCMYHTHPCNLEPIEAKDFIEEFGEKKEKVKEALANNNQELIFPNKEEKFLLPFSNSENISENNLVLK